MSTSSFPSYLKGTYPAALSLKGPLSLVQWLQFGVDDMIEPFMVTTLRRFAKTRSEIRPIPTKIDTLQWLARNEFSTPTAFVFHTSRCGSSVLVHVLRSIRDSAIFSEPPPLNFIANTPLGRDEWPKGTEGQVKLRDELIAGIVSAYVKMPARFHVIKYNSLTSLLIPVYRRLFPNIPMIFVYREPLEVTQANFTSPPPWVEFFLETGIATLLFGWPEDEAKNFPPEEFFARVYGGLCDGAIASTNKNMMLINYTQLNESLVPDILRHIGIPEEMVDREKLAQAFSMYSKDPRLVRSFTSDTLKKRAEASDALRQAVEQFAYPQYAQLEALRNLNAPTKTSPASGSSGAANQ